MVQKVKGLSDFQSLDSIIEDKGNHDGNHEATNENKKYVYKLKVDDTNDFKCENSFESFEKNQIFLTIRVKK